MGDQVAAEHGLHGEARIVAQFGHVGGGGTAADALVGLSVDQAAVEHAVPLASYYFLQIEMVGREDVVVVDAVAGEQLLVEHGAAVEVERTITAGKDQADGGAVEGALPGGDITQ